MTRAFAVWKAPADLGSKRSKIGWLINRKRKVFIRAIHTGSKAYPESAKRSTFGSRLAGIFQKELAFEAQNISTASIPYDDLEPISRYPTIDSQPIVLGFSLSPYYFSCTASTRFVVNVFRQLVDFVHDNQGWDQYVALTTLVDHSLAPVRDSWRFSSLLA